MIRSALQSILGFLSRMALKRYKPFVVAVTGSVGKTSSKDAIATVLSAQFHERVRKTEFNLNTGIGVPLAILGIKNSGRNAVLWVFRLMRASLIIIWQRKYPKVLVLEIAADRPGEIHYLANLVKPDVAIVTAVGEIPSHVEFFAGPKNLAREKARLVEALRPLGWAVLNYDDLTVLDMRERTDAHILTFGWGEKADVRATAYEIRTRAQNGMEIPVGLRFKAEYKGNIVPIRLNGVLGKPAVYAALSAIAVGVILKMNLVEIAEALDDYVSPLGRLDLKPGIKQSFILDSTYNSSPQAIRSALEVLAELPAKRRVAVLGDMLELGKFTEIAHKTVGEISLKSADELIFVGERMLFAADEAISRGKAENSVHHFSTSEEALEYAKKIIKPGDLVLVKGSRALRLEKIVAGLLEV